MAERCRFIAVTVSSEEGSCPEEAAYMLWAADCKSCAEAGLRIGIPGMDCIGHPACVSHAAEMRAGKLITPGGADMTVRRIQSIGVPRA